MYKFIKNNQKKMLAVFGVLLMIVFIIPSSAKYSHERSRRAIGKIGNTPVYDDEKRLLTDEWAMLKRVSVRLPFVNELIFPQGIPPQYQQFMQPDYRPQTVPFTYKLGMLARQIDEHPELYLLLKLEADRQGIQVAEDQVRSLIVNEFRGDYSDARLVSTARNFLLVQALYDRVANTVMVSQPVWQHAVNDRFQNVQLAVAEFTVDAMRHAVPAPTTQQIQQQFEKFQHVDPDAAQKPAEDPLGFGYQVPTRVKIQYLKVPHKAVVELARGDKTAYDWEVAARQYYYNHESDFNRPPPKVSPTTQPTTVPATNPSAAAPSTQPSTQPVAAAPPATGPSTRPFAEVQEEIMSKLLDDPAKALQQKIRDAIAHRLQTDFAAYHPSAGATSQPAGANEAAAFASKAYLDQVALAIQKEFKILPEVQQIGDAQSAAQLAKLPGIGQATTEKGMSFARYATAEEEAPEFPGAPKPEPAKALSLYEPSDFLHDFSSNEYIFRLTDSIPRHPPNLATVSSEVAADVQTSLAHDAAMDAAGKLLATARKEGLAKAAHAQSIGIFTTNPFVPGADPTIPGLTLSPEAAAQLSRRAANLLKTADPDSGEHPVSAVDLPQDRKVLVIELTGATSVADPSSLYRQQLMSVAQARQILIYNVTNDYFNYDAVKSRLQFHLDDAEKAGM